MSGAVKVPLPVSCHYRSQTGMSPKLADRDKGCSSYMAPSMKTQYMAMSLQANEASTRHNVLAALSTWLILAGYVVFPGTFTSLKNSHALGDSEGGKVVQHAVQNMPLLPLAMLCYITGVSGICWLWWTWRRNYVWLVRQIFLPALLNSLVGLITVLINVYTAQGGHWSVTAIIMAIVVGICAGSMLVAFLVYNWLLEKIRTPYDRELARRSRSKNIVDERTAV